MNVLMAFATRNGSTRQVADAVAGTLRDRGNQVAVLPARDVRGPLSGYDLVVLGAPLYSGRWHRDARRFLRRHRHEFPGVPVAVFGMGPRNDTPGAWESSRAQLDRALAKRPWAHPAAVTVFGGADPPGRTARLQRDLRDWDTIQAWAAQLITISASR